MFETPTQFTKILRKCLSLENKNQMETIKMNGKEAMRKDFSTEKEMIAYQHLFNEVLLLNEANL